MTAFEQGYEAFLKGKPQEENPHDKEKSPWSLAAWNRGWQKAQSNRRAKP